MKKYQKLYKLTKRRLEKLELKALDEHDSNRLQAIRLCKTALWDALCEVRANERGKGSN